MYPTLKTLRSNVSHMHSYALPEGIEFEQLFDAALQKQSTNQAVFTLLGITLCENCHTCDGSKL